MLSEDKLRELLTTIGDRLDLFECRVVNFPEKCLLFNIINWHNTVLF